MRKLSFLFAFILSVMGVTQAWADSFNQSFDYGFGSAYPKTTETEEKLVADGWHHEENRWSSYNGQIYDYASITDTKTLLIHKITASKKGQKFTVAAHNNGATEDDAILNVYYSTSANVPTSTDGCTQVGDFSKVVNEKSYNNGNCVNYEAGFELPSTGDYWIVLETKKISLGSVSTQDVDPISIYLNAKVWDVADATERYAVCAKYTNNATETWIDLTVVDREYDVYTAQILSGVSTIILVRMNGESSENNWNNKWNQTADITTINDNSLYTITGMNNGSYNYSSYSYNSGHSISTYTPSTYIISAGDAIAFGTIHEQATKTFTLTNTGTGALKNISIVSDNSNFTITNAPTELAAGASQEVTVTMLADQEGEQTGNITISAQWAENVVLGVSGTYAEAANMTIYLNTGANNEWGASNAQFVAWYWGNNISGKAVVFNAVAGETNTYSAVISGQATGVKLYRVASASADFNPNNSSFWNESYDLTPADNALFTFSSWVDKSTYTNFTTGNFEATGFVETFDGLTTNDSYTLNHSELPDWTISSGWGAFKSGNDVILYNYGNDGTAVLPRLYISGTNKTFHFWAYDKYTLTPSGVIKFEYAASADAETWIQVYSKTGFASSMTEYTFSGIPAGNWYIRMTVNDAAIGKVQGFTQTLHTQTATETATEYGLVDGVYDLTMTRTIAEGPNPMCLPFDVKKADFQRIFGEEATVLEFTGYVDGKVNLTKKDIDNLDVVMTAGTPYVVYSYNTASEMSFNNVNIDGTAAKTVQPAGQEGQFIGTYVKMCPGQKFFAISNKEIKSVKATVNIKGFRAYFLLPTTATSAKMVIDGVEDADATAISLVETDEGNGNLYDLSGRRVNNAQKGIYIQNGKKFVVK